VHSGFTWDVPDHFNFTRDVVEPLAASHERRALTYVDRTGLVQRLSFAELATDAARWAHLLRGTGLGTGDRVLVLLGNVPAWTGAMLGALKGGLVAVPCPEGLRARELAERARDTGARLLVCERAAQPEVDGMRAQLDDPIDVLYLDDAALLLPRQRMTGPTEPTLWCDEALILYTSGATGPPRAVTHSHAYTYAKRMQAEHWLTARPGDLVWCTASTGWAKAVWNSLLGPWSRGAEVVLHDGAFDPAERLELLHLLEVTVLCQTPAEYRRLAELDTLGERPLPALRHLVSTGEPLEPALIAHYRETLGLTIHDGYGQTETSVLVANTPEQEVRPGSMGWSTPGHDVAVIDEEGNEQAPGVEGDLALRGTPPTLFMRYWRQADETNAAFRDGWYETGDRATRDEDGSFWFTGRPDDVILSAAYRIGPFEVERALVEHPAVVESAVVGKPDPERGEIVKAFVVLRPGYDPSTELARELQDHAKQSIAAYKHPREIEFVSELPRTAGGKVRRAELRRLELTRAGGVATTPSAARVAAAALHAADEGATEFLREAAERRRAEEERLPTEAEQRRVELVEEEEVALAAFERDEQALLEERALAEAAAARALEEERERRRAEEAARELLEQTERRRRSALRMLEEERATLSDARSWRDRDEDTPTAGGTLAQRLSRYGVPVSDGGEEADGDAAA
jgi:acetyl-CoA synthetase/medium-chain acyl-CoA synthetase